MSRFFNPSDSDTESTSSEKSIPQVTASKFPATAFTLSDDEDDVKRVVKPTKDKRFEEMTNLIRQFKNHKKVKDMAQIVNNFEELCKAYAKALPVILKEENGITPRFYLRYLVELDDFISESWEDREFRKKLSKNNSKALGVVRQKLRKYVKDFEDEMETFRENPDEEDDDEIEKEESEDSMASEDEEGPVSFLKEATPKMEDGLEESDESDWSSDSEESSSSGDEVATGAASMFLKDTTEKEDKKKEPKKRKKEKRQRRKEEDDEDDGGGWQHVKGSSLPAEKPKMFGKDEEINIGAVVKKLNEIWAARGRKGTDRKEMIEMLQELHSISEANNLGVAMSIKIKFCIIAAIFDYNPKISNAMKPGHWEKLLVQIDEVLDTLLQTEDLVLGEHVPEDSEVLEKPPYRIRGCMLTIIERMDDEFTKLLKECDAHSNEYVERLKDEKKVCATIEKLEDYLVRQQISSELCRIYVRRIDHIYYKFDPDILDQKLGKIGPEVETSVNVMDRLSKYIYVRDTTDRLRTWAIMCQIYHHALHDNFYEARDLMLMSHLQDTIQHSDPPTQILYNRTMVQLGLCAFRHGNIRDAHNALLDIQSGGRAKELLAQGLILQRQHERTSEEEKKEKQRQMPFHKQINLELLECVYLVSAMLQEIPYMAAHEFDARRRMISKSFHHQLKVSERQALVGPPESMREHVVAASKAMRNGNWKACVNYIINDKMNSKVWKLFTQADKVQEMLKRKIQEETLRTYLFTFSQVYDSISMITLSEMFELDKAVVHSIVSKMIINEELMASLDEPTQAIVMHRTEPTRLQSMALQLADKVANLVEQNANILEVKSGTYYSRNQPGGFRDRPSYRQVQDWNRSRRDRMHAY